jgi:ATP-dependent Clp protease ATP-binding subunit ClpA
MFERFTDSARGVVVDAQEQARAIGHSDIMAEHLLLAIIAEGDSIGARVLGDLGVQHEALVTEVAALGRTDDEALRAIGVDLAAVRRQAEATFGPGALDRPRPRRYGLRRRVARVGGHLPFTASAKRALEESLRQAIALQHNHIGIDDILLGLLADDKDPTSRTLVRLGVTPPVVCTRVREQLGTAA